MPLQKPASVSADPFKSAKWDEVTRGRKFSQRHVATLTTLIQWHAVLQRCVDDLDSVEGQVAYTNDAGELRPFPQISIMKQASAEIRALNKQLGISDDVGAEEDAGGRSNVLQLVSGRRQERRSRAAN